MEEEAERKLEVEQEPPGILGLLGGLSQVSPSLGGLGFPPQVAGKSYSSIIEQTRERIIGNWYKNYFVRGSVDGMVAGRVDPINAIFPVHKMNFIEKLKRVDLLFGKRNGDNPALSTVLKDLLQRTPQEKTVEERARMTPGFSHLSPASKALLAFAAVGRASAREGDFARVEALLASGLDVNIKHPQTGRTLIQHAIYEGYIWITSEAPQATTHCEWL